MKKLVIQAAEDGVIGDCRSKGIWCETACREKTKLQIFAGMASERVDVREGMANALISICAILYTAAILLMRDKGKKVSTQTCTTILSGGGVSI